MDKNKELADNLRAAFETFKAAYHEAVKAGLNVSITNVYNSMNFGSIISGNGGSLFLNVNKTVNL
jgi:hypothetical protein